MSESNYLVETLSVGEVGDDKTLAKYLDSKLEKGLRLVSMVPTANGLRFVFSKGE